MEHSKEWACQMRHACACMAHHLRTGCARADLHCCADGKAAVTQAEGWLTLLGRHTNGGIHLACSLTAAPTAAVQRRNMILGRSRNQSSPWNEQLAMFSYFAAQRISLIMLAAAHQCCRISLLFISPLIDADASHHSLQFGPDWDCVAAFVFSCARIIEEHCSPRMHRCQRRRMALAATHASAATCAASSRFRLASAAASEMSAVAKRPRRLLSCWSGGSGRHPS